MIVDVAGVKVNNITKSEAIEMIDGFIQSGSPHFVVTPYSEMVVFAQNNPKYTEAINSADLSLPDGIGILWAAKYLHSEELLLKTLFAIIFDKPYIRSVIKEQVTGSRLVYDLAKLASDKSYSLALVGGVGNVAAQAAYELKKQFPGLKINLAISGRPFDEKIIQEINDSNSDILLIAYSPPKQETWLYENYKKLNCKVSMGLGGTFDYIAGNQPTAPNFMHYMGLEWLWRLVTQPRRIKRIWNAVPVFIWKIFMYKHHVRS